MYVYIYIYTYTHTHIQGAALLMGKVWPNLLFFVCRVANSGFQILNQMQQTYPCEHSFLEGQTVRLRQTVTYKHRSTHELST